MDNDTQVICDRIREGKLDPDALTKLAQSIGQAIADADLAFRWCIKLPDLEVRAGDIKPSEAVAVERRTGKDWGSVHPGRTAAEMVDVVTVLYMSRHGLDEAAAAARVDSWTVQQLADSIDFYSAAPTPFAEASPEG